MQRLTQLHHFALYRLKLARAQRLVAGHHPELLDPGQHISRLRERPVRGVEHGAKPLAIFPVTLMAKFLFPGALGALVRHGVVGGLGDLFAGGGSLQVSLVALGHLDAGALGAFLLKWVGDSHHGFLI